MASRESGNPYSYPVFVGAGGRDDGPRRTRQGPVLARHRRRTAAVEPRLRAASIPFGCGRRRCGPANQFLERGHGLGMALVVGFALLPHGFLLLPHGFLL